MEEHAPSSKTVRIIAVIALAVIMLFWVIPFFATGQPAGQSPVPVLRLGVEFFKDQSLAIFELATFTWIAAFVLLLVQKYIKIADWWLVAAMMAAAITILELLMLAVKT